MKADATHASEGGETADPAVLDTRLRGQIRRLLLNWFDEHRRDLPWRRDRNPYRIWVSEVMLQQTQAATVLRYFDSFLSAFPDMAALARADEQVVLTLWEGMGYYRRALHLHQAARRLVVENGGKIPDDPCQFAGLPGVGRYILGAVLSQAFECRLPIVEANSRRVLCRVFGHQSHNAAREHRWLWQTAEALLPSRRIGDFNQALMELGALVCTPRSPACEKCPLVKLCTARRAGMEESIPPRHKPPETVRIQEAAVVVRRADRVLLCRRPETGRWAGMWEFPHGPVDGQETHRAAALRLARQLTGLRVRIRRELGTIRHSVTHHAITLVSFDCSYRAGRFRSGFYVQGKWLDARALGRYPVSAPQRRLAKGLDSARR